MKSIQAEFDEKSKKISISKGAKEVEWPDICRQFNDDVSRVCDVTDVHDYTALFECFDDYNKRSFYLVREDKNLYRMKHRHFIDNLGLK
jgi:hypothetical protein